MSRPFPWKCATCRERAVEPVLLDSYTMPIEQDGQSYDVVLKDVPATKCSRCQTLVLDESVDDRLSEEFRNVVGLMRPAQIRDCREAIGLTQIEVARALSIGEATFARWESGDQIQTRAMDRFLRAYLDLPDLRSYLADHPLAAEMLPINELAH